MGRGQAPMTVAVAKGYRPGAIGRIAELHAAYYHREAAFGLYFESRVARELAEFCERYDDSRDGLWLAMNGSDVEGSIAIDGLGAHERGAHLRWFISSDRVRGSGAGTALLSSAMAFCRSQRYPFVYLWTFEGLDAARHLYEKFGFCLVHQQRGSQWGVEVNEQRFELRT
jgi:GNAT superfamily N-acetyltransferase